MNLDDLIQLLLFFVFIVVPLLSRVGRRRGQGGAKPGAPKTNTTRTNTPQTNTPRTGQGTRTPQARGSASQQTRPAQTGPTAGGDEFSKRLEEARRRVREAVECQSAQGRQTPEPMGQESASDLFRPSQAPSPTLPSDRDLLGPRTAGASGDTVTRGLMGQGTIGSGTDSSPRPSPFAPGDQQTFASLGERKKGAITKPLQVQRSLSAKRAKLRGPLLQFGEEDLMRGIIWKQILDEPRAKESWRQQSQRR